MTGQEILVDYYRIQTVLLFVFSRLSINREISLYLLKNSVLKYLYQNKANKKLIIKGFEHALGKQKRSGDTVTVTARSKHEKVANSEFAL